MSSEYAEELCTPGARETNKFGSTSIPDDGGTSHFCVVDRFGNVVTLTETINGEFGSLVIAEPFGVVLNNEMDDFATSPGKANMFGLVQGQANVVAPGKRPLSSMSPTIVLKDGRPVLTLGASGGPRIITAVMQVMLNVIEFDRPLEEAMSAVRLHHQWQPDEVYFDQDPPQQLVTALERAGQTISSKRKGAAVQAIQILSDGTIVGASDPRKGGRPVGLPYAARSRSDGRSVRVRQCRHALDNQVRLDLRARLARRTCTIPSSPAVHPDGLQAELLCRLVVVERLCATCRIRSRRTPSSASFSNAYSKFAVTACGCRRPSAVIIASNLTPSRASLWRTRRDRRSR